MDRLKQTFMKCKRPAQAMGAVILILHSKESLPERHQARSCRDEADGAGSHGHGSAWTIKLKKTCMKGKSGNDVDLAV